MLKLFICTESAANNEFYKPRRNFKMYVKKSQNIQTQYGTDCKNEEIF